LSRFLLVITKGDQQRSRSGFYVAIFSKNRSRSRDTEFNFMNELVLLWLKQAIIANWTRIGVQDVCQNRVM